MRKYLILTTILCTVIMSATFGQCPPNVSLGSQEDVNEFVVLYPNCSELQGNLSVGSPSDNAPYINDLSPLNQITSVAGHLFIVDSDSLWNLTGLENITSVGEILRIRGNDNLMNLTGLNGLVSVGFRVEIDDNDALPNMTGLENFTSAGGSLNITNNDALSNLYGIENLNSIQDLNIRNNDNLVDLSTLNTLTSLGGHSLYIRDNMILGSLVGLHNIMSIADSMEISGNPNLSVCDVESICNHIAAGNNPTIENNDEGCNTAEEIMEECEAQTQCPNQGIWLTDQQDVDDFISLYPNCTELLGDLIINGLGSSFFFNDLSPLNEITSIAGDLVISNTDSLSDLTGLENLTFVGERVRILGNKNLINLMGLNGLTSIGLSLDINLNGNLTNLNGLENLNSTGGFELINNDNLVDMSALSDLTSIGEHSLLIAHNDILSSLSGLDNIMFIENPTITDNPNLSVCHVESICNRIAAGNNPTIENNAEGCNTIEEIIDECIPQWECPPDWFVFKTQDEVDEFPTLYPNCTELTGSLIIGGTYDEPSFIADLSPLSQITSIAGGLNIRYNDTLSTLNGLDNITSIGGDLSVKHNNDLVLTGLEGLNSVGGYLTIRNTKSVDLTGLENITSIGEELTIASNSHLLSLEGLNNITSVEQMFITGNNNLVDLNGLEGITSVESWLRISSNEALINLNGLNNLTSVGEFLEIIDNQNLTSLDGLENLNSKVYLIIDYNNNLVDLSALSNLTSPGTSLYIVGNQNLESLTGLDNIISLDSIDIWSNPNLSTCHVESICNHILENGTDFISSAVFSNSEGCNTAEEVVEQCIGQLQCPLDDVTFNTQQQINDFPSLYPNCTEILGNLTIGGSLSTPSLIYDLNPLSQITFITGDLIIEHNDVLTSISDLENVTSIGGGIDIFYNNTLINLNGLENITSIGNLRISHNNVLNTLGGLTNLTSVGENLHIEYTNNLVSLTGLENVNSIGEHLVIENNENIVDLTALENLNSIGGSLAIRENENIVSLAGLENLSSVGHLAIIENESISDLTALENITSIGYLSIGFNNNLPNLTGLDNVTSVNILYIGYNNNLVNLEALGNITNSVESVLIVGNDNLISLNGLIGTTSVVGDLNIQSNNALNNLDGLNNITLVTGRLEVIDNQSITNLTGLDNLISVENNVQITYNDNLLDITGLNSLISTGALSINNNPSLVTLNGLENLDSTEHLSIINNDNLVDLNALSNLTSIGGTHRLLIVDNENLASLTGLDNMMLITDSIFINDNPNLSICHVESICNHIAEGGSLHTADNASGCNDIVEVAQNCSSLWESYIQGKIYFDENTNCEQNLSEPNLNDWLIKIEGEETVDYAYTYEGGNYIQPLAIGTYTVTAIPPNSLREEVCPNPTTFNLTDQNPIDTIDFGGSTSTFCPFLEVDITTPLLRRCFDNQYHVRYCNSGTATAENAFVEVQLDPFFTFIDATIEEVNLGNNLYSFNLGDIDIGECDEFQIEVYVDCNSTVIGQTHCVEAHIFPDSICTPANPLWDESSIMVNAECLGDSIEFTITNVGIGNMSDSLEYMVVEEDLIWHRANFQLDSGDNIKFSKPANGEYHRIEAQQSFGHPGNSMPSVFVEGCGEDDNGEFSLGFVNYYILDEGNAFISIDCQENIGAYDPNDKQAFPIGYGEQHYITDSTNLEYLIRFQNTGTDTAFNIVIRDTISSHLNIETLRPGIASHSYRYDIEGSNVAVFHFENIMLPDSNINEAASHGFIKFNIEQQRDNPLGTHIMNDAAIYFDFNEPIITNTVFHTIGEDFMGVVTSIITPPELEEVGVSVNISPNPFDEYTRFEVQGEATKELNLKLYDTMGREVLQQQSTHQQYIIMKRNNLPPGVYIFHLMDEKQQLATGKLIVK